MLCPRCAIDHSPIVAMITEDPCVEALVSAREADKALMLDAAARLRGLADALVREGLFILVEEARSVAKKLEDAR